MQSSWSLFLWGTQATESPSRDDINAAIADAMQGMTDLTQSNTVAEKNTDHAPNLDMSALPVPLERDGWIPFLREAVVDGAKYRKAFESQCASIEMDMSGNKKDNTPAGKELLGQIATMKRLMSDKTSSLEGWKAAAEALVHAEWQWNAERSSAPSPPKISETFADLFRRFFRS